MLGVLKTAQVPEFVVQRQRGLGANAGELLLELADRGRLRVLPDAPGELGNLALERLQRADQRLEARRELRSPLYLP